MSLMCPCPRCDNTDDFAMCENALLDAQISVDKAEQSTFRWKLIFVTVLLILAIALAIRPSAA